MTTGSAARSVPLDRKVLALLALAAQRGHSNISYVSFYDVFPDLVRRFPDAFPGLAFVRMGDSEYSKRLEDALQRWVGNTIDLPNPRLKYLVLEEGAAERHLAWLRRKYGDEETWLDDFAPVADSFVELLNAKS